jgi:guanosine-3',5'-bis(diphosphate) 3'-pyrophosphohydrolase|tara:strand:+ start:4043 stop:6166 length:2124 start_codon:yes stop_codon:yes gene_type:complete
MQQPDFIKNIKSKDSDANQSLIEKAYFFALEAHKSQKRYSGDPYISHPVKVAEILTNLKLDTATIITGLLHDTVEDTPASMEELKKIFGNEIASLVDGVTKISKMKTHSDVKNQAENFRKLILAVSKDIRVLLVKLADRLHNMRTISYVPNEEKRKRIALETMEIYAPLAGRLGMQSFRDELEDLSFQILNAAAYTSIKNRVDYLKNSSSNLTEKINIQIVNLLKEESILCEVIGREKKIYSIWNKMQRKEIAFRQLSDIFAYRIVTDNKNDCYKALGIIHSKWSVVPGSFKDYISTPKINNYSSLHTTIVGPQRQRVELQIRTKDMSEIADSGIAAHWQYKDNYNLVDDSSSDPINVTWLRDLVDILDSGATSEELLEATKLEMFQQQVFCFTPKGDLIHLPINSNPIDFAYALHSEIGNMCIGCKVNGKSQPLFAKLQNGDEVEILTSKGQEPSEVWENIATTAKAQTSIKRYFKKQENSDFVDLGKRILLNSLGFSKEIPENVANEMMVKFKKKSFNDLMISIGRGHIKNKEIIKFKPRKRLSFFTRYRKNPNQTLPLEIKGLQPGLAVHFAECCLPLPDERIIGVSEIDIGVIIHNSNCKKLNEDFSEDLWLAATWKDISEEQLFTSRIKVSVVNEPGSLGMLATHIGKHGGNIINLNISEKSNDFFDMIFEMNLKSLDHLNVIIKNLKELDRVSMVKRLFIN